MRSSRQFWSPWWAQIIAGLFIVMLAVGPWLWLWLGQREQAMLPTSKNDAAGLIIIFAIIALLGGWFTRVMGRRSTSFAILTDIGVLLALVGLVFQWIWGDAPEIFQGKVSDPLQAQLWALGVVFVISQVLYFLIAKLRLSIVALLVAALVFNVGQWLQMVATYTPLEPEIYSSLIYGGALILGLVLGFLGFLQIWHLVVWVIALAIQWVMPAVISAVVTLLENPVGSVGGSLAKFGELSQDAIGQTDWLIPSLVTLAVAMLVSVTLLIVRKAKRRT
ncbi:hypothetical protein [Arthrobacter sp. MYb213]|uniref:hypothetical protein n=1 Tax=Arthrobacter sp. MYb213 TaxID=1848595 RepID=UPI000CFBDABE|nr:hypothetical protein [Arthrobacter sp. MYb213]PRB68071.1 hypothetical protein CQ011_14335 [Arthrobacter sp. MYb213]